MNLREVRGGGQSSEGRNAFQGCNLPPVSAPRRASTVPFGGVGPGGRTCGVPHVKEDNSSVGRGPAARRRACKFYKRGVAVRTRDRCGYFQGGGVVLPRGRGNVRSRGDGQLGQATGLITGCPAACLRPWGTKTCKWTASYQTGGEEIT